jgi:hypothetical protein
MTRLVHESPRQAQFRRDCEDAGFNVVIVGSTAGDTYGVEYGTADAPTSQDVIDSTKIKLSATNHNGSPVLYVGAAHR